ncbi:Protein DBF4 like protein A [Nosema granulosis]|uniref:Protein DBF4 like protein A n=1 Tax=Nosema granulosis TaxID=83296 RepID=A0A9P6KYV7_9MICR|nr:Protein DBF4 like protein A [Nosema granulosis]
MKNYKIFKSPYILIGDVKDRHQPFYKEYTKPPRLFLNSPQLCCPFQENKRFKAGLSKKTKKPGFCEICYTKYADYNTHVLEYEHREFAKDKANFVGIDLFISRFEEEESPYTKAISPLSKITSSMNYFDSHGSELTYENILNISKVSTDNEDVEAEYVNITHFMNCNSN